MSTESHAALPVAELWRYPVKSVGGERIDSTEIGPAGMVGDRRWALLDRATGLTLTARRVPELLFATARLVGDDVEIELPDGTRTRDDDLLSRWLAREVTLRDATGDDEAATYEIALDDDGAVGDHQDWVQWEGPTWSFHDSAHTQVSIVSTATLGAWDRRRFRANVVVHADTPGIEDAWIGTRLTAGTAVLEVTKPIDRCVMVTRPQPDGVGRDLEVLRTIARERAGNLAIGTVVSEPGHLAVGDLIAPRP